MRVYKDLTNEEMKTLLSIKICDYDWSFMWNDPEYDKNSEELLLRKNQYYNIMFRFIMPKKILMKYFEINEMLDRETNKTNSISKSNFVFHFFQRRRKSKTIKIDYTFLYFFNAKVGVLNVQRCKWKIQY